MVSMSAAPLFGSGEPPVSGGPPVVGEDEIFKSLVESNPAPRKGSRSFPVSVTLHVVVLLGVFVIPLYLGGLPDHPNYIAAIFYDPPPALAASLPKGRQLVETREKPKPVRENPKKDTTPTLETPLEVVPETPPDTGAKVTEQAGSETGTEHGIMEGMEGGSDQGVAGGVLDGQLGGCVGCTGTGPVVSPDEPPKILSKVNPAYPQDAFIKKIEGIVRVEVVIDATGSVIKAKIVRSVPPLDAAAVACVRQWRFMPARHHGVPVATISDIDIYFRIF